jgi:hypothetical protein
MTENTPHPTPPPELVEKWAREVHSDAWSDVWQHVATQAARWGADQELEACCEWLAQGPFDPNFAHLALRAARRPKPPSLKEQALKAVERMQDLYPHMNNAATIRRALEQLP